MTGGDQYKLFGVYVSGPVADALADTLYDEAGVVDPETYFDDSMDSVPAGDPGGEVTAALVADIRASFTDLYDRADFESAAAVAPDAFSLVHLAATPQTVTEVRERFRAAATIQETDLRTVQTAILAAALDVETTA